MIHRNASRIDRSLLPARGKPPTDVPILQAPIFTPMDDVLMHGFSSRKGGKSLAFGGKTLNLGFASADRKADVEFNRTLFLNTLATQAVSQRSAALITLRQIHSDIVHLIGGIPTLPLTGDGLITDSPGLVLAIQSADCLPVLLADFRKQAVGAFHAGWRGTAKRIVQKGVGMMRLAFGSDPEDIVAAIGPGIHACCYGVGEDVAAEFESQFAYGSELVSEVSNSDPVKMKYPLLFLTARAPGHSNLGPEVHLDLPQANRAQLLEAGVPRHNIWISNLCTACRPDILFSHRAEAGFTGRMMGAIGLRV